ncbi:hypothetical protein Ga0466249_002784 [Sporomusaceae bacterium BoRhaA]|uniref:hypothetical protein n=1 Tax=Pelorhabdus rhamnosifermentans TaxID=2772457 RepID=UPI001C062F0A|nr:hypothetical protein [Pelorhabdus rhamnosifermentans]MBU2701665.1 hypothetical protein [Pelorhabdus rhamnosifermentans]
MSDLKALIVRYNTAQKAGEELDDIIDDIALELTTLCVTGDFSEGNQAVQIINAYAAKKRKTNFTIVVNEGGFQIMPTTEMGESLKAHCRYHGATFVYPTYVGAKTAISHMDQAIENRNGKPWQAFQVK